MLSLEGHHQLLLELLAKAVSLLIDSKAQFETRAGEVGRWRPLFDALE